MELYPERMVADVACLPGDTHSFLKRVCAPDGALIRARLDARVAGLAEPVAARVAPLLTSVDNRRFFQGYAEVAALAALGRGGWSATRLVSPGPRIALRADDGSDDEGVLLSVLAFLHQARPVGDDAVRARLAGALAGVSGRARIAVLVRRWLAHDVDPEPIRRAVERWLVEVDAGRWPGRYATYENDHVSLEFCLTGERAAPGRSPVALVMGPFLGHRTLEVVEPRVVQELDRHMASQEGARPLVVACVSDQPWTLGAGYVRDFLYGRARSMSFGESGPALEVGGSASPCVFRDPSYGAVSAVVFIDRDPSVPSTVRARGYMNPYARVPLAARALGVRCLAPPDGAPRPRTTDDVVPLCWHDAFPAEVEL